MVRRSCPGAGLPVSAGGVGERVRCPCCGHLIAVTARGKLRKHNGRRASAPPKRGDARARAARLAIVVEGDLRAACAK